MKREFNTKQRMPLLKNTLVTCKKDCMPFFENGNVYSVLQPNTISDNDGVGHTWSIGMFMKHFSEVPKVF